MRAKLPKVRTGPWLVLRSSAPHHESSLSITTEGAPSDVTMGEPTHCAADIDLIALWQSLHLNGNSSAARPRGAERFLSCIPLLACPLRKLPPNRSIQRLGGICVTRLTILYNSIGRRQTPHPPGFPAHIAFANGLTACGAECAAERRFC
jgi:hypothetical protein